MKELTILMSFLLLFSVNLKSQELKANTITDIDSNIYQTVVIGNYEWMAQNLKTTTYNNGTKIPNVTDSNTWVGLKSGAYCWYNNNENNANTYGALYNWYAVNTCQLCPLGWRVPSDKEWKYLEGFVDNKYGPEAPVWDSTRSRGYDVGQQLKSTSGWRNGNGSNAFGFNAIPGGERASKGRFLFNGESGFYWSSSESDTSRAKYRCLIYFIDNIFRNDHPKFMGFSVRCIRDKR